jgi:hypothetical protein
VTTDAIDPIAPALTGVDAPSAKRDGAFLFGALLVLAAGAKTVLFDTLDPDCFWHLRVAQAIAAHGVHPLVDDLSFSSLRTPWVPYSWLAELAMKMVWDTVGWRGAVAVQAAVIATWALLVLSLCRELARQSDARPRDIGVRCGVATAGGMFLGLPYLSFRPYTFALVILGTVALLMLRDRGRRSGLVWLAVPLTALCANVHPLAWTAALWPGGLLIEDLMGNKPWHRRALLVALVALASLATPLLPGVIGTAWGYQFDDVMIARSGIAELQSVFRDGMGIVWGIVALSLLFGGWWNRKRIGIAPLIWLAVTTIMLVRLGRFAPLCALAAAPVAAALMTWLGDAALGRPTIRAMLAITLAIGIWRVSMQLPRPRSELSDWLNRHGPDTPGYPTAAADYLSRLPAPAGRDGGRIINDFTWGGYLAWRLGPEYRVFMDGRTQLYPREFWEQTLLGDASACARAVAATRADAAILPLKRTDWRDALIARGWHLAFEDDRAMVLLPAGAARARGE